MRLADIDCPLRLYKERENITYRTLAERLGISEDYARKLGCGRLTSVSPKLARRIEKRSHGRITYIELMRWVERHLGDSAAA